MKKKALKAAFPYTIPIGIGFLSGTDGQCQTFILWPFHAG